MVETSVMIGIVMALAELFKRTETIPAKYIPIMNLLMGIVGSFIWKQTDWRTALFEGIVVGLAASGLFSSGKNVYQQTLK